MNAAARVPGIVDAALAPDDFRMIIALAHRSAGLVVHAHKEAMVRGRLSRRARDLGLASVGEYCAILRSPELDGELPHLLNALTTNHTSFYREAHHFEHLGQVALPSLMPNGPQDARRFRIWCAAASSGEEPFTIAATVHGFAQGRPFNDLRILATDIDSEVLKRAEAAVYPASTLEELSPAQKQTFLLRQAGSAGSFQIGEELRRMLAFRRLNIIEEWPFKGPFDIIFCRNMLIYFDQETKKRLVERFVAMLRPGGFLYLGHSEALPFAFAQLEPCGRTVYRRI